MRLLADGKPQTFHEYIQWSQEAAMVALMYEETHNAVASKSIRTDLPASWITLTLMKCSHYRSMAHLYLASALLLNKGDHEIP